jgi:hypothetical protein
VLLVLAALLVAAAIGVRFVADFAPDARPGAGQAGFGAPQDAPALELPDDVGPPAEPTGPTGPTAPAGPVVCPPPPEPVELAPSARAEREARAAVTADYRFRSPASSVATAPDLVPAGEGGGLEFGHDEEIEQRVLFFRDGAGFSLRPTEGVIDNDRYTIELVFLFRDRSGYAKIIDFREGSVDDGLYGLNGCLILYPEPPAPTRTIRPDSYVQVVLTRDASSRVIAYVNGVRQFSFRDVDGVAAIDENDALWFFRDDTVTSGEFSDGSVARIRLYDRPLTAHEVAAIACGELREVLSLETCRREPG